jgi:hypothetical protein
VQTIDKYSKNLRNDEPKVKSFTDSNGQLPPGFNPGRVKEGSLLLLFLFFHRNIQLIIFIMHFLSLYISYIREDQ